MDTELAKQLADIQRQSRHRRSRQISGIRHEQTGMPFEDYKNEMQESDLLTQARDPPGSHRARFKFKREELEAILQRA